MRIIDKSFIKNPKSYIIQSLLTVIAIAIILYFVEVLTHADIVAHGWSYQVVIFVLASAVSLAIIRRLLRRYLRDLFWTPVKS
jgi:membrane protein implicated in regulation of membrane protease activity